MRIEIMAVLILGSLAASVAATAQSANTDLEHVVVEMADTPAEHQALVRHYMALAERARADERRHEQLARVYLVTRNPGRQRSNHCEQIAQKFGEIAAEYDELAKLHAEEARSAQ